MRRWYFFSGQTQISDGENIAFSGIRESIARPDIVYEIITKEYSARYGVDVVLVAFNVIYELED